MNVTDRLKNEHPHLHAHRGKIVGHRIVVEGLYLAKPSKRDAAGHFEKRQVKYREEFILAPSEHRLHGQGSLGHILSDEKLAKRLSEKDPEFRAIKTHVVAEHENLYEFSEEQAAEKAKVEKERKRREDELAAFKDGDAVVLPGGATGVIVDILEGRRAADVKLDVNGNVSRVDLIFLVPHKPLPVPQA